MTDLALALPHVAALSWMDPQYLLDHFGSQFFWVGIVIVFIECGLLFPILPGDSLLFAIGMFIKRGDIHTNLGVALMGLSLAAFAGNVVGYEIGRLVGTPLYNRDGRLLKRKYFDQTIEFFDKYGNRALIIGRFVPVVRTFITVVAGVGRMPRRRFFTWSAIGAVAWACLITLLGYFLGGVGFIHDNLEAAILAIVVISLLPMVYEWWRHRRQAGTTRAGATRITSAGDTQTDAPRETQAGTGGRTARHRR